MAWVNAGGPSGRGQTNAVDTDSRVALPQQASRVRPGRMLFEYQKEVGRKSVYCQWCGGTVDDCSCGCIRVVPESSVETSERTKILRPRSVLDLHGGVPLSGLGVLSLANKRLTSLRGLDAPLPSLTVLYIHDNILRDFQGLGIHPQLKEIHAQGNELRSLKGLPLQPRLHEMNVARTPLGMEPLHRMAIICCSGRYLRVIDGTMVTRTERRATGNLAAGTADVLRQGGKLVKLAPAWPTDPTWDPHAIDQKKMDKSKRPTSALAACRAATVAKHTAETKGCDVGLSSLVQLVAASRLELEAEVAQLVDPGAVTLRVSGTSDRGHQILQEKKRSLRQKHQQKATPTASPSSEVTSTMRVLMRSVFSLWLNLGRDLQSTRIAAMSRGTRSALRTSFVVWKSLPKTESVEGSSGDMEEDVSATPPHSTQTNETCAKEKIRSPAMDPLEVQIDEPCSKEETEIPPENGGTTSKVATEMADPAHVPQEPAIALITVIEAWRMAASLMSAKRHLQERHNWNR